MFGKGQRAYISGDSGLIGNSVRSEPERNKEQGICNLLLVTHFVLDLWVFS